MFSGFMGIYRRKEGIGGARGGPRGWRARPVGGGEPWTLVAASFIPSRVLQVLCVDIVPKITLAKVSVRLESDQSAQRQCGQRCTRMCREGARPSQNPAQEARRGASPIDRTKNRPAKPTANTASVTTTKTHANKEVSRPKDIATEATTIDTTEFA